MGPYIIKKTVAPNIQIKKTKENLNMSQGMQRNMKTTSHSHKEENTNTRTTAKTNKLEVDNLEEKMVSRVADKQKIMGKLIQP